MTDGYSAQVTLTRLEDGGWSAHTEGIGSGRCETPEAALTIWVNEARRARNELAIGAFGSLDDAERRLYFELTSLLG